MWIRYGNNLPLFNLLSRTSTSFFMYEQGFESLDPGKRIVALDNIDAWTDTLDSVISKKSVRELLEILTPRQFTDLIFEVKPKNLPIYAVFDKGQNPAEALWFNMYLRTLQHEKYFRGKMYSPGKLINAVFAPRLITEEDKFLENQKSNLLVAMREVADDNRIAKSLRAVKKAN